MYKIKAPMHDSPVAEEEQRDENVEQEMLERFRSARKEERWRLCAGDVTCRTAENEQR